MDGFITAHFPDPLPSPSHAVCLPYVCEICFPKSQNYSPSRHFLLLPFPYSVLFCSPLLHSRALSETAFPRFFQPFPLALRVAASCCFFVVKCFITNLAFPVLRFSGAQTFHTLQQLHILRSSKVVRILM